MAEGGRNQDGAAEFCQNWAGMAMVVGRTRPESLVAPIFQAYTKKNRDRYCKYKVIGSLAFIRRK
jgi:hypothetical protein